MSVETYYRDEIGYLREMGALFARANPHLSRYLAEDASDPDVERLLEGFAFLVGRLHQRLDAETPELAYGLLQLVAPHYLRPVPPITTIQFRVAEGAGGAVIRVPKGTTVQTAAIEGEAVTFRTSFDVAVMPFEIAAVDLDNREESSVISLSFNCRAGARLQALGEAPLDLFFNGRRDPAVARLLHLFFMEHLGAVQFTPNGGEPVAAPVVISRRGFENDEATLPYPDGAFAGFRILQEYFACPEKFMHARIGGLDAFAGMQADGFTLSFEMTRRFPGPSQINTDHFALNATPAINLFEADGEPFRMEHDRAEYPVRVAEAPEKRSVHAVESVIGHMEASGERIDYEPFERFRHDAATGGTERPYFRTRVRPAIIGGGFDHCLSFATRLDESGMPAAETISTRLICSNGPLASKVGVGAVSRPTPMTPAKVAFSNVTPVTAEVPPPVNDKALWTLLAALPRNFASIVDVGALRAILGAHDFRAVSDRQAGRRRDVFLQGLQRFERKRIDIIRGGRPVPAHELALFVSEKQVGGEGEMYLFGTVLDRFLKSYAGINSLHRFSMTGLDTGTALRWLPKWGEAATP
jgi:type VI secretion system protein ImpG